LLDYGVYLKYQWSNPKLVTIGYYFDRDHCAESV